MLLPQTNLMPWSQTSLTPGHAKVTNQFLTRQCHGYKPVSDQALSRPQISLWPGDTSVSTNQSNLSTTRSCQCHKPIWWHNHKPVYEQAMPRSKTSHWLGNALGTNQSLTRQYHAKTSHWPGHAVITNQSLTRQCHAHKPVIDQVMQSSQSSQWQGNVTLTKQSLTR